MKTKTILLIDDEEDFGILVKSYFNTKNFTVYQALTIADGMELLATLKPDFVLLDNNLPDGYGWGKTEHILVNYPETQLNLISANYNKSSRISTFRILEKPIHLNELNKLFQ